MKIPKEPRISQLEGAKPSEGRTSQGAASNTGSGMQTETVPLLKVKSKTANPTRKTAQGFFRSVPIDKKEPSPDALEE